MTTRPLAAVSLKAYLSQSQTLRWCRQVRGRAGGLLDDVDLLVVPMATALVPVGRLLRGTGIELGAQDCSWAPVGAYTGELPASALFDAGARVVELGHAERRSLFGEDDEIVAKKVARAVAAGLVPMVCVGEPERVPPEEAAARCVRQAAAAVGAVPADVPVRIAYEPFWAIGADEPAPAEHVGPVCRVLRDWARGRGSGSRVLYGGTAGPGTFTALFPDVDGLFLGRRAHDVSGLVEVLREMSAVVGRHGAGRPHEDEGTRRV